MTPVCGPARCSVFVILAPRAAIAGVAAGAFGFAGWAGWAVVVVLTAIGEPTEASELGLAT